MILRSILAGIAMWVALSGAALANDVAAAVQNLSAALLARDEPGIRSLFDASAGYAYALEGPLSTGESFERWLSNDIIATGRVFVVDTLMVDGQRALVEATYGIGTPSSFRRYLFEVNAAGLIVAWRIEH
jgi:hypothetical protein